MVLRLSYPDCDFEVEGAGDRGKVAEQEVDTHLSGNGHKQSLVLPQSLLLASIVEEKRGMMSSFLDTPGKT